MFSLSLANVSLSNSTLTGLSSPLYIICCKLLSSVNPSLVTVIDVVAYFASTVVFAFITLLASNFAFPTYHPTNILFSLIGFSAGASTLYPLLAIDNFVSTTSLPFLNVTVYSFVATVTFNSISSSTDTMYVPSSSAVNSVVPFATDVTW